MLYTTKNKKKGYGEIGIEIVKRVHQTTVISIKQQHGENGNKFTNTLWEPFNITLI